MNQTKTQPVDEVQTENMSNLSYLPLSHENIIRSILLYSDSKTLLACENVCTTWRWWISSSTIWPDMLELVATRAKSLAWSIRYCTLRVGEGWLNDCASDFLINRIEHLEEGKKKIPNEECKERAIKLDTLMKNTKDIMGSAEYARPLFDLLKLYND